jgi:hypothetical protein
MAKKKVTLSLDEDNYKEFQRFCDENDIILSKRIDRLIRDHLNDNKTKKGGSASK